MINTIVNEIPYERDTRVGYALGTVIAVALYVVVPITGDQFFLPVTILLFAIDSFYALVGFAKYLNKTNKPKMLMVVLLTNYIYLWRRSV